MAEINQQVLNLENLPDLVLREIFSYLDHFDLKQTAMVSKKFYTLSRNKKFISTTRINLSKMACICDFRSAVWSYPEIDVFGRNSSQILRFVKEYGYLVKHLEIDCLVDSFNLEILKYTPNLSTLKMNVVYSFMGNTTLNADTIISHLPQIREFAFNIVHCANSHLWKQFRNILQFVDRRVDFRTQTVISFNELDLNKNLEELNIDGRSVSEGINKGPPTLINLIFKKHENLQKLSIENYDDDFDMPDDINDVSIDKLKFLKLSKVTLPTDALQFLKRFRNLISLKIIDCKNIENRDIILIFNELKNLQEFEVKGIQSLNESVNSNVDFPKNENIVKIELDRCGMFSENLLINIAKNFPKLKELIVICTIKEIHIDTIRFILKNLRNLQKFECLHRFWINTGKLQKELSICTLENMEHLALSGVNIFNEFRFPKLKCLRIYSCPLFTTQDLQRIGTNSQFLRILCVVCCKPLGPAIIQDLMKFKNFQMLKKIYICKCQRVGFVDKNLFGGVPEVLKLLCFKCTF